MDDTFTNIQIGFYHKLYKDEDIPDFLIRQIYKPDLTQEQFSYLNEENRIKYMSNKINQICDLKISDSSIQFQQDNTLEDKKVDSMLIGKRILDLHGYTSLGSSQSARRLLLLLDKSHPSVIKFNVGKGTHSEPSKDQRNIKSEDGELQHTTRKCVIQVCKELNLPQPQTHPKNKGYLIERLSARVFDENQGNT